VRLTSETKHLDYPLNFGHTDTFVPTASLAIAIRPYYQYLIAWSAAKAALRPECLRKQLN
jgi:hypothetical protein